MTRATVHDVAGRAGVSVATVSRVLGGEYPVAAATRTKVLRAIRELDYVVNAHARALSGSRSRTVAIVLGSVTSPFYNQVASGIQAQAEAEDRLCLICATGDDQHREAAVAAMLREQSVDAMIFIGGTVDTPEYRRRTERLARTLDAAGSRLVFCGRPSPDAELPITVVDYDDEGGAFSAASHLSSAGHSRVLFVGGYAGHTTTERRLAGFHRAAASFGREVDPDYVRLGPMSRAFGYRTTADALARKLEFTAVFGVDDDTAAGAVAALRDAGLRVPDDVSVIGYNDLPPAEDVYPPLTTVHIPHQEIGRTAVRLALQHADADPPAQHVVLGTHIVVRGSVAPPGR